MKINAKFHPKFKVLFQKFRYKILKGGRGSGKSWAIARALLILGTQSVHRILCFREYQNSIKDSVMKLLADQIIDLGLTGFYEVQNTTIKGINGTEFIFEGLRHNATKIKSFEGITIAWGEEAQTISKQSWDILIPTIRKEDSEIWISFNPILDTDETYVRFILNPPENSAIVDVNWSDNPWFPEVLYKEMLELKERDHDSYLNVWEGHCRVTLDGAVYANEIRDAIANNRITNVPYNPTAPVHTFWDLGYSDKTAIWFIQKVGFEYRAIDYIEDNKKSLQDYIIQLQTRPYVYGTDWLPHDAKQEQMSAGGKSIYHQLRSLGRNVDIVPRLTIPAGINAARSIFNQVYFDQVRCKQGLECLKRYRYATDDETGQVSKLPLHDWSSHGADAFRYFAVGYKEQKTHGKTQAINNYDPFSQ